MKVVQDFLGFFGLEGDALELLGDVLDLLFLQEDVPLDFKVLFLVKRALRYYELHVVDRLSSLDLVESRVDFLHSGDVVLDNCFLSVELVVHVLDPVFEQVSGFHFKVLQSRVLNELVL